MVRGSVRPVRDQHPMPSVLGRPAGGFYCGASDGGRISRRAQGNVCASKRELRRIDGAFRSACGAADMFDVTNLIRDGLGCR